MGALIYDLVVLGIGGMGSATLAHASGRGRHILGIEQFARGHDFGASSGRSRIIRKAYFENPAYVPLVVRAYELWRELEVKTDTKIMDLVGALTVGNDRSAVMQGVSSTARMYDLPHERLDADQIARRYPGTKPRSDESGIFERDAGIVFPEAAIDAHLRVAEANGAEMRFSTVATAYEPSTDGITVRFADGGAAIASTLAICAGPWLGQVARELQLPLRVQRNVQIWFRPSTPAFSIDRFPTFLVDRPEWPALLYGFPDYGDGVKAALHGYGESTDATNLDRMIRLEDITAVKALLDDWIRGAAAEFAYGKACMYTLTPDEHFVIDRHPEDPRIVIAGGFSGHGFKFASVVGELVTELAFNNSSRHPIGFLSIDRFAKTQRDMP